VPTHPTPLRVVMFDEALHEELRAIDLRREKVYREYREDDKPSASVDADPQAPDLVARPQDFEEACASELAVENGIREERNRALGQHTVGLAFSGGGIRSATFAVGILQGLSRLRLLGRIDYLSTVSGGGYAGGWLAAWLKREGSTLNVEKQLSVIRTLQARAERGRLLPKRFVADEEPEPIYHLRSFSRYMAPQAGLLTGDTWSAIAIYLRNVTINLLMLLPAALAIVMLTRVVVWIYGWAATPWVEGSWASFQVLVFGSILTALGTAMMGLGFWSNAMAVNQLRRDDPTERPPIDRQGMIFFVVIPLAATVLYIPLAMVLLRKNIPVDRFFPWLYRTIGPWIPSEFLGISAIVVLLGFVLSCLTFLRKWRFADHGFVVALTLMVVLNPTAWMIALATIFLSVLLWIKGAKNWVYVVTIGLAPATIAILLWPSHLFSDTPHTHGPGELLRWYDIAFLAAFFSVLLGGIFMLVGDPHAAAGSLTPEQVEAARSRRKLLRSNAFLSGAAGGCLFAIAEWALRRYLDRPDIMATFTPPVGLMIIVATSFFHVAQLGRSIEEPEREWWGRFAAYMMMLAVGWLIVFGTIIYLPALLILLSYQVSPYVNVGLLATWLGTTIAGILSGKSEQTGVAGRGSVPLEAIARIAPPVFLVGLFCALSFVARAMLDPWIPPDPGHSRGAAYFVQEKEGGALAPVAVEQGPPNGLPQASRYLRAVRDGEIGRLAFWMAGLSMLTYVVSYLVDVNLFSLHSMYSNRLIRAYLGASRYKRRWRDRWRGGDRTAGGGAPTNSREPERRENPVTGFDPGDDIPLSDLRIGSTAGGTTYPGPILLVNTSLELVASDELAWADRKAESFVLSPMHCGAKGTGYARVHPTADLRKNLTLGRAMAISGAAVDPNMNYHQSSALTAFLTIFNARLGYWIENPMPKAGLLAGPAAEKLTTSIRRETIEAARREIEAAAREIELAEKKRVAAEEALERRRGVDPGPAACLVSDTEAEFDKALIRMRDAARNAEVADGPLAGDRKRLTAARSKRKSASLKLEEVECRREAAAHAHAVARAKFDQVVFEGGPAGSDLAVAAAALEVAEARELAAALELEAARGKVVEADAKCMEADRMIEAAASQALREPAEKLNAARQQRDFARDAFARDFPDLPALEREVAAATEEKRGAERAKEADVEKLRAAEADGADVVWTARSPEYSSLLVSELLAKTDGKGDYVHLSDGGHFENTGVYELIRRRCRYIIACDANADPEASDENIANLVRLVRIDFGIRIALDTSPLRREGPDELSRAHAVVGRVHYDDVDGGQLPGVFVYVRTSMTGDEPADIQNYAKVNTEFPFTSSSNQFFDEAQFESYRALGQHVARSVFEDAKRDAEREELFWSRPDFESEFKRGNQLLFSAMKRRWAESPPDRHERSLETSRAWSRLQKDLRTDNRLAALSRQLYSGLAHSEEIPSPPAKSKTIPPRLRRSPRVSDADIHRAELHAVAQMLRIMEDARDSLRLDGREDLSLERGWLNVFRRWTITETFHRLWPTLRSEFSGEFVRFCESQLRLSVSRPEVFAVGPKQYDPDIRLMAGEFDREWHWPQAPRKDGTGGVTGLASTVKTLGELIDQARSLKLHRVNRPGSFTPAWLIYQGSNGLVPHPGGKRTACGIILAWKDTQVDHAYQFFVWIRPSHRSMGIGSRCVRDRLNELLEGLEGLEGEQPFTLYVRHPSKRNFGVDTSERLKWIGFYSQFDFRPRPGDTMEQQDELTLHKLRGPSPRRG
jgi:hypothetical protein